MKPKKINNWNCLARGVLNIFKRNLVALVTMFLLVKLSLVGLLAGSVTGTISLPPASSLPNPIDVTVNSIDWALYGQNSGYSITTETGGPDSFSTLQNSDFVLNYTSSALSQPWLAWRGGTSPASGTNEMFAFSDYNINNDYLQFTHTLLATNETLQVYLTSYDIRYDISATLSSGGSYTTNDVPLPLSNGDGTGQGNSSGLLTLVVNGNIGDTLTITLADDVNNVSSTAYANVGINGIIAYAGLLYNVSLTAAPAYADVGSNSTVTVSIDPSAIQSHAVTVTLVNNNPTESSLSSTNAAQITITFPAGGTNVMTIPVEIMGYGSSQITASGTALRTAQIAIGSSIPRTLLDAFRASSIAGYTNGQPLPVWISDTNHILAANTNGIGSEVGTAPIFHANATPSGTPAVKFSNGSLSVSTNATPIGGLTNFSIALVFRANANGLGGPAAPPYNYNWDQMGGVVDGFDNGGANDWGIALDYAGLLNYAVGNPDTTIAETNYPLVNAAFHVAVVSEDAQNGQMRLTVDGQPTVTSISSQAYPRDHSPIYFGSTSGFLYPGIPDLGAFFFKGEIAEIQFYNGALTVAETTNLIGTLRSKYDLAFQALSVNATPSTTSSGQNVTVTVGIPAGANSVNPVVVMVTNDTTSVLKLCSTNAAATTLTFATGATNQQSFVAQVQGLGSANIRVGTPGLDPASIQVVGSTHPGSIIGSLVNPTNSNPFNISANAYDFAYFGDTPQDTKAAGPGAFGTPIPVGWNLDTTASDSGVPGFIGVSFTGATPNSTGTDVGAEIYNDVFWGAGGGLQETYTLGSSEDYVQILVVSYDATAAFSATLSSGGSYFSSGPLPYTPNGTGIGDGNSWGLYNLDVKGSPGDVLTFTVQVGQQIYGYPNVGFEAATASAIVKPVLTITKGTSKTVIVSWTGSGTLLQSASVAGPYTPVSGNPTSPYTTTASGTQEYYELETTP